ncbi:MAG TPA: HAD family acid phosphatase [Croceibacterium sp.]|nr:HAD family acid phosphatase [Croceibacterium sp.]
MAALACSGAVPAQQPANQDPAPSAPPGLQFLYGSGEAAAISRQTYRALEAYALAAVASRPRDSVVMAAGATLASPAFVPCANKPLAAVFDIDETVILNTGLIHARATGSVTGGPAGLAVQAVPGAVEALTALRQAGITPVYNTNRTTGMAEGVVAALRSVGLDSPVVGETLFLSGFDGMGPNKDGRRSAIAAKYCVIAMAGDQLGDFTERLREIPSVAARRAATLSPGIADKWGNGWFMLANTAYGTALEGGLADVFPGLAPAANDN